VAGRGRPTRSGEEVERAPPKSLPLEEESLLARWPLALREPRRLAAILLLGLTGGLILAFLTARGELAGADARAYWVAIRFWLGDVNAYAPPEPFLPHAYAPWTLYLFLPWALLPFDMAWFIWRAVSIGAFAATVAWAYERRPLATALLVAAIGAALAANLDTGNINMPIVLGIWAAWFLRPPAGGFTFALAAASKWLPVAFILFIPARVRLWGLAWLALFVVLTLAVWPETLLQFDVVFNLQRPLRLDYIFLIWAAVPWLWSQPWPPTWLTPEGARDQLRQLRHPRAWLRSFLGLPADNPDTSTRAAAGRR
jgi:hypothetical protein